MYRFFHLSKVKIQNKVHFEQKKTKKKCDYFVKIEGKNVNLDFRFLSTANELKFEFLNEKNDFFKQI